METTISSLLSQTQAIIH